MKEIISDTTKFEQINIEQDKQLNFLLKSEKKVIDLIKRLENEGKISEKEYELIYPRGSRPGVLYGSPKVHKPVINNCPKCCPILSTIGTPTHKLAKFLVPILSPLTSNEFSVHDSFSFADKVSGFCPDHFMASLDIESLFTNIPLNEIIDICIDDLFCDTNTIQNLDRNDMRELLNLTAYESFVIFDQVMYRQIDGVAMGSPLGPILANAFLCHFEKQWLSECPPDFLPKVFKRYVDDIFVMFLCQSHLEDFVNYMNTKNPNIKFTSEFEQNDFFSFLDVKITRSNNQLITSVFRKATFSGVFTNFKSFMPVTYKFGLVHTLLHRSFSICSSYEKFHEEIVLLKKVFKKNEYPQFFIDKCIKKNT